MVTRRLFLTGVLASMLASLTAPLLALLPFRLEGGGGRVSRHGFCIDLPMPRLKGTVSLEECLANRRSIREYLDEPLEFWQVSQILWAAYGITETRYGFKTSPSAGATYPAEIYLVVGERSVRMPDGSYMRPGSYHYNPHAHRICLVREGDLRADLARAALGQRWVRDAPISIVVTVVFERTTSVYGERGIRYVWMEVGHIGQNIYLQATALGLATVAVGAFIDEEVMEVIGAPPHHHPAYIMPVGKPVKPYRLDPKALQEYIEKHRG